MTATVAPIGTRLRRARVRRGLVVLEGLLAAGAGLGGLGLVTGGIDLGDATSDLPFASPVPAAVALVLVNGLVPLVVAVGALRRRGWADGGHIAVGVALVGWIVVQVAFIGLGSWLQVAYALYGAVVVALGITLIRARAR